MNSAKFTNADVSYPIYTSILLKRPMKKCFMRQKKKFCSK